MARINPRVQRLRRELKESRSLGMTAESELASYRDRAARLFLDVLRDEGHPLAEQLKALKALIAEYDDLSDRHLFMPQPGISNPEIRRFWPLQLLMINAARSSSCDELADIIELSNGKLQDAANKGAEVSVELWSTPQYAQNLCQAVERLDYPDPAVSLEDRLLRQGGKEARLSSQEARFLRLLRDHAGVWVKLAILRQEHGFNRPANVKLSLMKKVAKARISLEILAKQQAYMVQAGSLG